MSGKPPPLCEQHRRWEYVTPNKETRDGEFQVELPEDYAVPSAPKAKRCERAEGRMDITIRVWRPGTRRMSDKAIRIGKGGRPYFAGTKGYWTKSGHSRYYLDELIPIGSDEGARGKDAEEKG